MKTHTIKSTPYWIVILMLSVIAVFFLLFAVVAKQDTDVNLKLAMKNEAMAEREMTLSLIKVEMAVKAKKIAEEQLVQAQRCCEKCQNLK